MASRNTYSSSTKESIFKINTKNGIGIKVTTFVLNGKIFLIWINVAGRGLIALSVFGHVNGDIQSPEKGTNEYNEWLYADTMVFTWITNSIDSTHVDAFESVKDAKDLWEEINRWFGERGNLLRIYDLKQDLQSLNLKSGDF
ncbi:hypothetical protein ACH5RR_040568 [Cinchona calisaya]|uniref:Uncharacterized protein n=1 Tax=Cinchona calisaya TaxID=153742 RepID=A0ABD2XT92_9GENT